MVTDTPAKRPGPLIDAAREARRKGDWEEALRLWRAARDVAPDRPTIYEGEAESLAALGRNEEADALLATMVVRFPDNLALVIRAAEFTQRHGAAALAAQRWQALAQHFSDRPAAAIRAAAGLADGGKFNDSEAVLIAAGERFPKNFAVAAAFARLAERRSDWTEALRRWEATRERFPHHPDIGPAIEAASAQRDLVPPRRDPVPATAPAMAPGAPEPGARIAGSPLKDTIRLMLDRHEDDGGGHYAPTSRLARRPQGIVARLKQLFGRRAQPGPR